MLDYPFGYIARRSAGRVSHPAVSAAVVFCLAALLVAPAQAALWKWVDSNGHVVYSDTQPAANVKAERVNAAAPPANPNAVKEMANQDAELRKRQMQRDDDAAKSEKARADATRRQESCAQTRGQLKSMQNTNTAYYRFNEKGERVFMDEGMRRKEGERLEAYLRAQCPA